MIRDVTGRVYNLGPYRKPVREQEKEDPLNRFKANLADSGIAVEES